MLFIYTVLVIFMNLPFRIEFSATKLIQFRSPIYAGFPSPAEDYAKDVIDLKEQLIVNENATFLFRVRGNSMIGIGIYDGDTLIVDRSIEPVHNDIVLAVVDGDFTVKRLHQKNTEIKLIAENPAFPSITFKEGQELCIWGVVTFNLHRLKKSKHHVGTSS